MKPWRPDSWTNDFPNPFVTYICPELAFEAGADAMLEALREMGISIIVDGDWYRAEKEFVELAHKACRNRWKLVFIPEGE